MVIFDEIVLRSMIQNALLHYSGWFGIREPLRESSSRRPEKQRGAARECSMAQNQYALKRKKRSHSLSLCRC